jgi:hypothetical protein
LLPLLGFLAPWNVWCCCWVCASLLLLLLHWQACQEVLFEEGWVSCHPEELVVEQGCR